MKQTVHFVKICIHNVPQILHSGLCPKMHNKQPNRPNLLINFREVSSLFLALCPLPPSQPLLLYKGYRLKYVDILQTPPSLYLLHSLCMTPSFNIIQLNTCYPINFVIHIRKLNIFSLSPSKTLEIRNLHLVSLPDLCTSPHLDNPVPRMHSCK